MSCFIRTAHQRCRSFTVPRIYRNADKGFEVRQQRRNLAIDLAGRGQDFNDFLRDFGGVRLAC